MPANTTTYNFFLPTVGGDTDAWGGYLNTNWSDLDDLLDGTTPVTGINITSGSISGLTSLAVAGTGANAFVTSVEDAGTANILNVAQFLHTTTSTPAIGIGTSIQLGAETEVGTTIGVQLDAVTTAIADATDGEAFDYVIKTKAAGVATPAERVRINSTGIDVTGLAESDGVSTGDLIVTSTQPKIFLSETDATDLNTEILNSGGFAFIRTTNDARSSSTNRIRIDNSTGDISFYEDTGTTAKFFWDASAESLGIGTSSPASDAKLTIADANVPYLFFNRTGVGAGDSAIGMPGSAALAFYTPSDSTTVSGLTEAMRIDSSGKLLVGKATSGSATAGLELDGLNDVALFTRGAGQPLILNRLSNDGSIVELRKDGTTMGSIGSFSGYLNLWRGNAGIALNSNSVAVTPSSSTGESDNTIDIGRAGARFKNLYLSGGVYVGGTGSANYLDDYEEGTWTPTIEGITTAGTANYLGRWGRYVKIGNLVSVRFYLNINSFTGTGVMRLSGLPFTNTTTNGIAAGSFYPTRINSNIALTSDGAISIVVNEGATNATFYSTSVTTTAISSAIDCDASWAGQFEGTYIISE